MLLVTLINESHGVQLIQQRLIKLF